MLDNNARYKHIREYVQDRDVLDIGVVQHDLENVDSENWLHGQVVEDAANAVGIDILEEEVTALQNRGYDVRCANAESFELDQSFDLIIAGELIEHLSNCGQFLDCCRNHLREDGQVVITTPNGVSILIPIRRLLQYEVHNQEHTCMFDAQTLSQLLQRHGFQVERTEYLKTNQVHSIRPKQILHEVLEVLPPDRISNQTLLMVAKPVNH